MDDRWHLKSINTKDKLYTILIQTDTEDEHLSTRLRSEFITHRTVIRRNIRKAKQMYYTRTFDVYKNYIKNMVCNKLNLQ